MNDCILPEWHQVGEQETICGLDLVLFVHRKLCVTRAHGMADEGQSHVQTAPIVATPSPFFGPGSLSLWREAVIEEEPRIAFKGLQVCLVRKDERRSHKAPRPLLRSFHVAGVEKHQVLSGSRGGKVPVRRMKISQLARGLLQRHGSHLPLDLIDWLTSANKLYPRGAKERHGEITLQVDSILGKSNAGWKGLDQILAVVAVIKSSGSKEKSNGSVDGMLRSSIPRDPQTHAF